MPRKEANLQIVPRKTPSDSKGDARGEHSRGKTPLVSGRWLLFALCATIAAACLCGWLGLCLLFWQGSWQLLYHPAAVVTKTPNSAGLAFDPVAFAATDTGVTRLKGWWIPAPQQSSLARFTVIYLHGQDGNLSDTVDALVRLHGIGVNVFAFDYRGYGASQFVRPSEAHLREDADWTVDYLTGTRQIDAGTIVLDGTGLGANLALEVAAEHPELAGVVVESPNAEAVDPIFSDPRAHMVPARLLVRDRYDLDAAAAAVRIPVLWIQPTMHDEESRAYAQVTTRKIMVWLNPAGDMYKQTEDSLSRWLDELPAR
jgi:pimeloyl-ACP methyl ester carboxylesterase